MIRPGTMMWIGTAALAGVALFVVKYKVQDLNDELASLKSKIRVEQETVHVLKAEWSYLNRPERLEKLATRHLELEPVVPGQLGSFATEDPVGRNDK